jgi:lysine 6-dehydrogenase
LICFYDAKIEGEEYIQLDMSRICVLGGGLVGRFVACTLLQRGHEICLVDSEQITNLPSAIDLVQTMIQPENISQIVSGFSVVVNCLPGRIGHAVRAPLLRCQGMLVADLAFTLEDPRELNQLAIDNNSTMVYDIGIAPGLSNALLMDAQCDFNSLQSAKIWVGGNPQQSDDEWSYMAPFSPSDVIEEYTRPARIRRSGVNVIEPPLTQRHAVSVPGYGQMEAFLTDGLRSLLDTIHSQELLEYTVRWPGHIDRYIAGNFSEQELLNAWKFDDDRPEFTWLAIEVVAEQGSRRWDIIDEGKDGWSSMARTTGLVTVEVAEMLAEGLISQSGVMAPEILGQSKHLLQRITDRMSNSGVKITLSE